MYERSFFGSKLGQAAIASTLAMIAFVALSTQIDATQSIATTAMYDMVELA